MPSPFSFPIHAGSFHASQQYKQKKTGEDNRKIAFPCILYSKGV
jgi:hypothetical protein